MITIPQIRENSILNSNRKKWEKYCTPLMNLGNTFTKGTDPRTIGSLKDAWKEMRMQDIDPTLENWEKFCDTNLNTEEKLADSGKKLYSMLQKFKEAIEHLDEEQCVEYVKEITYNKSVMGFSYEEVAIETVAKYFNLSYRFSTKEEESQGIDGFIGEKPVQVKKGKSVKKNHVRNHANEFKTLVVLYDEKKKSCEIVNPEFMSTPN